MSDSLFVWVTLDPTGKWSQIGALNPSTGERMTLAHRRREVAEQFRELAFVHGLGLGQRVELRRYEHVETLEVRE